MTYDFDPELAAIIPLLPTTSLESVDDIVTARTSMVDLIDAFNADVDLSGIEVTDHLVARSDGCP